MRKWLVFVVALCACVAAQAAYQVTDDAGVVVTFQKPPQRIVTLLPSLTETVCELHACDRIVGVDSYSNWPASVADLPHVGGIDDANVERIVALNPDVVLLGATSRVAPRLRDLGIPVIGLELKTLGDVRRVLAIVAHAIGVTGADDVWRRMNDGIAAAAHAVPPAKRGASVYFEVGADGYAASASSHIGEILTRLGATNVVPGNLGTVPRLNPEFIVRADPQVIMVPPSSVESLKHRPGWSRIRAVRDGRVCAFTSAENDVIMRPGPRLAEAAHVLAKCLKDGP